MGGKFYDMAKKLMDDICSRDPRYCDYEFLQESLRQTIEAAYLCGLQNKKPSDIDAILGELKTSDNL